MNATRQIGCVLECRVSIGPLGCLTTRRCRDGICVEFPFAGDPAVAKRVLAGAGKPLTAGLQESAEIRAPAGLVALDEWQYLPGRDQARPRVDASCRNRRLPEL